MAAKGYETITVTPRSTADWQDDRTNGTPFDIEGVHVIPKYSDEAETIVSGYTLYATRAAVVGAQQVTEKDRIRARGKDWAVDGVPGVFTKKGRVVAVEIVLKRAGS